MVERIDMMYKPKPLPAGLRRGNKKTFKECLAEEMRKQPKRRLRPSIRVALEMMLSCAAIFAISFCGLLLG